MSKVRMRFTISGEYDAEVDEDTYGTTDPNEMAQVDQQQLRQDPLSFAEDASEFTVVIVRIEP